MDFFFLFSQGAFAQKSPQDDCDPAFVSQWLQDEDVLPRGLPLRIKGPWQKAILLLQYIFHLRLFADQMPLRYSPGVLIKMFFHILWSKDTKGQQKEIVAHPLITTWQMLSPAYI